MKIAVLIKSVPDTASLLSIGQDGKTVCVEQCSQVINPYDEYALEEAVRLKEKGGGEVIAVSMGDENSMKIIRAALAVGADRAVFINSSSTAALSARMTAKILAAALKEIGPDLVFAGKQAADYDGAQVPERAAEILGFSHVSAITRLALTGTNAEVDREIEGGAATMRVPLPALFTVSKGINTPRYPTLPNIMKAKRKEIKEISPAELLSESGLEATRLEVVKLSQPRQERLLKFFAGEIETQVRQIFSLIRQESSVI